MHEKPDKVISPGVEPEQHTDSHIVYPALHGPVHCLGMPGIVAFRPGRVQHLVVFPVVSLLEQDVCADSGFFQPAVIVDGRSCDIYIDTAYGSVPVVRAVYRGYRFEDVFDGIMYRVFP